MSGSSIGLAILAGSLTTLSPCVLPVLPLVLGSSLRVGRRGPLFFAAGLLVTFVGTTWLLSSFGSLLGLGRAHIRLISAAFLSLAGLLLLSEKLQEVMAALLAPLLRRAEAASVTLGQPESTETGWNQFVLGALTGVIWTPCSGPSLGVAVGLAASGGNSLQVISVLTAFGTGAVIPLLIVAYGSQTVVKKLKSYSRSSSGYIKKALGTLIFVMGISILFGWDKHLESILVGITPEWLSDLTTKF